MGPQRPPEAAKLPLLATLVSSSCLLPTVRFNRHLMFGFEAFLHPFFLSAFTILSPSLFLLHCPGLRPRRALPHLRGFRFPFFLSVSSAFSFLFPFAASLSPIVVLRHADRRNRFLALSLFSALS